MAAETKLVSPWGYPLDESGRRITSTVFNYEQAEQWNNRGFLTMHEVIRRNIELMIRVFSPEFVAGNVDMEAWKVRNFFLWYNKYFFPSVHHHHDVEERIYIPWVSSRVAVPPKITADHKQLLELLDRIRDYEKQFKQTIEQHDGAGFQSACDAFRKMLSELQELMLPHLEEEERQVSPLVGQHFTEKEETKIIDKIIKDLGKDAASQDLPLIIMAAEEWGGARAVEYYYSVLPGPVRYLCRNKWIPTARGNNLGLLRSLMDNKDSWRQRSYGSACTIL